jgi:hypothetical protein
MVLFKSTQLFIIPFFERLALKCWHHMIKILNILLFWQNIDDFVSGRFE